MNDEKQEQAYWLLLAFESKLSKRAISDIIEHWCRQRSGTLQEFFSLTAHQWSHICQLDENIVAKLTSASEKIADQITLAERLMKRGMHMLTVLDEKYPAMLKSTLSLSATPPVLFYIGNLEILDLLSVAIIGSATRQRKALNLPV